MTGSLQAAAPDRGSSALAALVAIGAAMLAFAMAGPWIVRTAGYLVFIPALVASGMLTLAATRLSADVPLRSGLVVILAFALTVRLVVVAEEPLLSTDIYRYVWDGRVQAAGINPYRYVPADAALAALRDASIFPSINRADYAVTIYPPVAQMFFLAATRIAETITGMRLALVACEVGTVLLIIDLLRRLGRPMTMVVAYAWHPLAIWEIANNGHVDGLMIALMMLGLWLLVRTRVVAGTIAVALAVLVKPYVVVALAAFWRPWDWRTPLAAVVTAALCYLPYLGVGRGVFGYLAGYASEEGLAEGEGFWLTHLVQSVVGPVPGLTIVYALLALAVLGLLVLRGLRQADRTPQQTVAFIMALLMTGLFFVSSNYAWYFLALVALLPLTGGAPAWVLTLAVFLLYRPHYIATFNDYIATFNELAWKSAVFIPFLIALVMTVARRRTAAGVKGVSYG